MALTKISRTLLDTGVSDSSDATAITIDSSERVGIGESSPDELLVINGDVKIKSTNKLHFTNTSDQTSIHAPASNTIALSTNSTEAMRVDSSGRVMIGTTTEGRAGEGADMFTIGDTSNNSGMTMRSGTSGYGSIYFSDATTGTGEYSGYVQYAHNGDMMLLASGSETRIRIDSDGLKFGSDSAAANALDDYEEGTWTPAAGPEATISGLPFAVQTTGSYQEPQFVIYTYGAGPTGITGAVGPSNSLIPGQLSFYLNGGESQGRGRKFTTNADAQLPANEAFDSNTFVKGVVIYYTS